LHPPQIKSHVDFCKSYILLKTITLTHKRFSYSSSFNRNGIEWLGGNFDKAYFDAIPTVNYVIKISHKGLRFGAYSVYQKKLSDKVLALRDIDHQTYKQIADQLIMNGYRSPRGFELGPESVFSIYKKRKIRDTRLLSPPTIEVLWLDVKE